MKPKIILCLALVLSGGLFGCYDIASADETNRTEFFKGDDLKQYPLEISCLFQED
jgi:hypothetical protein